MFHLMTHAFFKALLFLAAGLLIHALSGEQDIRKMSGIGQLMPWTRWAFLAGALALVGVPPFAGFFSKDAIIAAALHDHWYGVIFWVVALIGAFLTGLYTFRMYFIVFPGAPVPFVRELAYGLQDHGEGPRTMLVPVGVLAVLATFGGWIQFSPLWHPVTSWLAPVAATLGVAEPTSWQEGLSSALAVGLGLAGIGVAYAIYGRRRVAVPRLPALQRALEHKLYFDEAYDALLYKPAAAFATSLRRDFEEPVILAASTDVGDGALEVGRSVRSLQTGLLRTYVFFLGAGMAIVAVVFLVVR
jgi:NADH-quinone oxidoreductase subunit L